MRATTSSGESALESTSIASSALRSGAAARVESRVSRATMSAFVWAAVLLTLGDGISIVVKYFWN